jgi:hypothetical protein
MRQDVTIEIVVILEKPAGLSKVVYCSSVVPAGQTMDLYVSEIKKSIALYHPEAYENDILRTRRAQNSMTYPGTQEKMLHVGQVTTSLSLNPQSHMEVCRAQLHLTGIPIDEL